MANLPDMFRTNRSLFSDFFRDLDDLFGATSGSSGAGIEMWQPTMNLHERQNDFVLSVDLPGVKQDDVKIEINDNVLSLSAERHQTFGEGKSSRGRRYGQFQQSFTLPRGIKAEQIQAHYDNGVLDIVIPKSVETQKKSIRVQSGRAQTIEAPVHAGGRESTSGQAREGSREDSRDGSREDGQRLAEKMPPSGAKPDSANANPRVNH